VEGKKEGGDFFLHIVFFHGEGGELVKRGARARLVDPFHTPSSPSQMENRPSLSLRSFHPQGFDRVRFLAALPRPQRTLAPARSSPAVPSIPVMGPVLGADPISRGRRLTRCSDGAAVFFSSQRGGGNAWLLYSLNGEDAGILRAKAGSYCTVRFAFSAPVVMPTLIIFGFYSCCGSCDYSFSTLSELIMGIMAFHVRGCYSLLVHLSRRLTN
jgi:hypothetical protein